VRQCSGTEELPETGDGIDECVAKVGSAMRAEAKVVIVGFDWGEGGAGAGSAGTVHVRTMGE
jgi:hypothetical protein